MALGCADEVGGGVVGGGGGGGAGGCGLNGRGGVVILVRRS